MILNNKFLYCIFFICNLNVNIQATDSFNNNIDTAINYINNKSYIEARHILENILKNQNNDKAQYYLAQSYFLENNFEFSIVEFQILIASYPNSIFILNSYYWLAESYYLLEQYENATTNYFYILNNYPTKKYAEYAGYSIGYIFILQNKIDEAIAILNRMQEEYPFSNININIKYELAKAYIKDQSLQKAQRLLTHIIINTNDIEIIENSNLLLAEINIQENNFIEAENKLNNIFRTTLSKKNKQKALQNILFIRDKQGDSDDGKTYILKFIHDFPNYEFMDEILLYLSHILLKENKYDALLKVQMEILQKYPNTFHIQECIDSIYNILQNKNDIQSFITFVDNILEDINIISKNKKILLKKKADAYFLMQEYKLASKIYENKLLYTSQKEIDIENIFLNAQSYFKLKNYYKSSLYLNKILSAPIYIKNIETWKSNASYLSGEIAFKTKSYSKALNFYNLNLKQTNKNININSMLGIGWTYFYLKQFIRAADIFLKVLTINYKKNNQEEEAIFAIASCYYNLRYFNEASIYYNKLLEHKNEYYEESLFQLGKTKYKSNKFEEAYQIFINYVNQYPDTNKTIEAYYLQAWSLYELNEINKSIDILSTLKNNAQIQKSIFYPKIFLSLGKFYDALLNYQESCNYYLYFINNFDNITDEVYYLYANCSLLLSKPDIALHISNSISSKSPYYKEILTSIAEYYTAQKNIKEALILYKKIERLSNNFAEEWNSKIASIDLYILQNKTEEAKIILENIIKNTQDEFIGYTIAALTKLYNIYFKKETYNILIELINKYKNHKNDDIKKYTNLTMGKLLIEKGEYQKARTFLQPLTLDNNYKIDSLFYTGLSYYRNKNFHYAFDYFEQVASIEEQILASQATFFLGEIYFIRQDYLKAITQYEKIIYENSDKLSLYEQSLYKTALCYFKLGYMDLYEKYKKEIISSFANSSYIKLLK